MLFKWGSMNCEGTMQYALIMAGGSGTRLWPMSRTALPKQLIPFVGGKSLLQVAYERLQGLVPQECCYICGSEEHRELILKALPGFSPSRFLGEPVGRDTLNAVGLGAAILGQLDPEAIIAVFTADHIITPMEKFQEVIARGFHMVEQSPDTLVTFGITPTTAATGYGYLELAKPLPGGAFTLQQFQEKPDSVTAQFYFQKGPEHYLWNSGMFVWRASTLMDCLRRYEPANYEGLHRIAESWNEDDAAGTIAAVYPTLKKISVDFAIMEPASRDSKVRVAAIPMEVDWLDVGSWPMFSRTCPLDEKGNALASDKNLLLDTHHTLVASSDSKHLIATIGCEHMIIIHTADATLVCPANRAESIKELHRLIGEKFGPAVL
jgi:mannose-1-phosphate guanylyltransferase